MRPNNNNYLETFINKRIYKYYMKHQEEKIVINNKYISFSYMKNLS